MLVSLILSLPCLSELSDDSCTSCEGAFVLIAQQAENLKALECDNLKCMNSSWYDIERLPYQHTLKHLSIGSLDEEQCSHVFFLSV